MIYDLSRRRDSESFALTAENPNGEKGRGGSLTEGTGKYCARELGIGWKISPSVLVKEYETITIADYRGEGYIRHIWITDTGHVDRNLILRIYWDGSDVPSVETPLGDFFCAARHNDYRHLDSIPVSVNPRKALNCYWDMPFRKGFRVTLENLSDESFTVYYQFDCEKCAVPEDSLYFHAQFRRVNPLPEGSVYTILDGVKGRGHYVGTYLYWSPKSNGWWGEGEVKFFIDGDSEFPTVCGTGTEDYFCGSHDFDYDGKYVEYSSAYCGMYKIDKQDETYLSQKRFNMYRWHLNDPVYFSRDLKVTVQALGWRSEGRYHLLTDDISSVAFWYQDTISDSFPSFPSKDEIEIL
ncbi:MAG: DUF2961 domain-containing protein [Clostridia bacterium]|nr:DUF2961 domain-containing protein [Clostridia bacterium]